MTRPARFVFPNPPPVLGSPNFGNDAQGYLGAFPALRDYIEATADWYETDFAKSLPNGTAALPALAFTSQANTGLYRPATSILAISVNGTERARFTTTGMQVGGSEVFRRANILGAVSQSAGVPTGAIIQRGSNANGEFVRFADGTQICNARLTFIQQFSVSNRLGVNWTFPAGFSGPPITHVNMPMGLSDRWANFTGGDPRSKIRASGSGSDSKTAAFLTAYTEIDTVTATSVVTDVSVTAIGQWF